MSTVTPAQLVSGNAVTVAPLICLGSAKIKVTFLIFVDIYGLCSSSSSQQILKTENRTVIGGVG